MLGGKDCTTFPTRPCTSCDLRHTSSFRVNIDQLLSVTLHAKKVRPVNREGKRVVKSRWRMRLAGVPEPTGRGVIAIPTKIIDGPEAGRISELEIPASRMAAHIRQLQHAHERERTLQAWARGGPEGEQVSGQG